jgi:hypothetical protein
MKPWKQRPWDRNSPAYRPRCNFRLLGSCKCKPGDHTCEKLRPSMASRPAKFRRAMQFGGGGYEPSSARRERHNKKLREDVRRSRARGAGGTTR